MPQTIVAAKCSISRGAMLFRKQISLTITKPYTLLRLYPYVEQNVYLCRSMDKINDIPDYLNRKGVKPTPNRILVAKELINASSPISLADLEETISTMNKASIFRVLELFTEKEMVHVIKDGSRSLKYEICPSHHHSISDQHMHFYCEKCDKVYCLEQIAIPHIGIPDSYLVKSMDFILKGICPECRKKSD